MLSTGLLSCQLCRQDNKELKASQCDYQDSVSKIKMKEKKLLGSSVEHMLVCTQLGERNKAMFSVLTT